MASGFFTLSIGACALVLAGCASVGPQTVSRDRFDYVTAISDSAKRQMLLNVVKVRYGELPVFVDVASVIGAYSLEGEIVGIGEYALPGTYMSGDRIARVEATGRYTDKPTITYHPLAGDKFAKSLMGAIPVSGILFLIQSGYPADVVLRTAVISINGIENAFGGHSNAHAGSPRFRELMDAIREAQASGIIGFRSKAGKTAPDVVMFVRDGRADVGPSKRRIEQLLGLRGGKREFKVGYGSVPDKDTDIAVLTRSILQVMGDFASYVDVSAGDIAEGRVNLAQRTPEQERLFPALVNVRSGPSRPLDAFVAIQYRDQWFWIDDRDQHSKLMLTFLMLLFSLTEVEPAKQPSPLVTVPAR
jgi:hypothetical protein